MVDKKLGWLYNSKNLWYNRLQDQPSTCEETVGSKRRIRRQNEKRDQARQQLLTGTGTVMATKATPLFGGIGRTSVADMVLQKHRFIHDENKDDKPQIQVVNPDTPLPGTAAPAVAPTPTSPVGKITTDIINEETRRHQEIVKLARLNQEHYLRTAAEKPWFQSPRNPVQYSEYVLLNGAMAQICLDNIWQEDEGNRRLARNDVDKYKRDMMNGSWIPTDEAIGVDYQGRVYNGRHRLTAITELWAEGHQIEVPLYFTFNVLTTARFVIDSGRVRPMSDRLRLIVDTPLGNRTAGFCKAVMRGSAKSKIKYTESEVAAFSHKWESLIAWIATNLPYARAEVQAAVAKAYLWYGPEKIEPFCERFREIKFIDDGDPARALFVALTRQKVNRINAQGVAYKKTMAALHAAVNGHSMNKLYEREEDLFQWLPGWEIPAKK